MKNPHSGALGPVLDHPEVGPIDVVPVDPVRTYRLRREVLRPHQEVEEMSALGSEHEDALVVGAVLRSTGEVVGTGGVAPEQPPAALAEARPHSVSLPSPAPEPERWWRLRAMATAPGLRGSGVGAAVVDALLDHVARLGGGVVWCKARTPAVGFYGRAGFRSFGEPWTEPRVGPHVLMWRLVTAGESALGSGAGTGPSSG